MFEKVLFRDQRDRELGFVKRDAQPSEEQVRRREQWKRDMVFRPDGLNQYYLCAIWEEMVDYAFNFTYPWSEHQFLFGCYMPRGTLTRFAEGHFVPGHQYDDHDNGFNVSHPILPLDGLESPYRECNILGLRHSRCALA